MRENQSGESCSLQVCYPSTFFIETKVGSDMEMPPLILDIKCEVMEVVEPSNDQDPLAYYEEVVENTGRSSQEENVSNFKTSREEYGRILQENRLCHSQAQEEPPFGIEVVSIKVEPEEMESDPVPIPIPVSELDSSWNWVETITDTGRNEHQLDLKHVVPFSPRNAFRIPQNTPAKKAAQLVVWNAKPQPIKIEEKKVKDKKKPIENEPFFVLKSSNSDDQENIKPKKKRNKSKKAIVGRLPVRKSIKRKKGRNKVQVSKQEDYRQLLQSYITSKRTKESKRMKGNGDANLKWLLDFKVDTLFQQEDENRVRHSSNPPRRSRSGSGSMGVPQAEQAPPTQRSLFDSSNPEHAFTVDLGIVDDVAHFEQVECPSPVPVPVTPPVTTAEPKRRPAPPPRRNCTSEISFDEQGKPRCTYTELIERALTESGGLTVSEIYQWISDHYPFFSPTDDRWKNSVRHNLSINPYFKKGDKARSGAGHLWTISEESRALRHAVRKKGNESQELSMSIENETDRAVASILGQYNLAKANMDVGGQELEAEDDSEMPSGDSSIENSNTNVDPKVVDVTPSAGTVFVDYGNSEYPDGEFTIELNGLCIPESGLDFDDLISSGRLIFIQTNDKDADKENIHCESSEIEQRMDTDFAEMHSESPSQATERISGQLISEALTQEFSSNKPIGSITPNYLDTHNFHDMHVERHNLSNMSTPGSQDFMALESIDLIALQDVMNTPNGSGSLDHYHSMIGAGFEPRDIGYTCNYDHEAL